MDGYLAGKPHRVFIADIGHRRQRVDSKRSDWRGNRAPKAKFFNHAHLAGILHAFDNFHAAGATLAEAVTVDKLVQPRPDAVQPLVGVDARLDSFFPQVSTCGDLDFFLFLDEFNNWHSLRTPRSIQK